MLYQRGLCVFSSIYSKGLFSVPGSTRVVGFVKSGRSKRRNCEKISYLALAGCVRARVCERERGLGRWSDVGFDGNIVFSRSTLVER